MVRCTERRKILLLGACLFAMAKRLGRTKSKEQVEMDQNIDDLWSMDDIDICLLYCIYIYIYRHGWWMILWCIYIYGQWMMMYDYHWLTFNVIDQNHVTCNIQSYDSIWAMPSYIGLLIEYWESANSGYSMEVHWWPSHKIWMSYPMYGNLWWQRLWQTVECFWGPNIWDRSIFGKDEHSWHFRRVGFLVKVKPLSLLGNIHYRYYRKTYSVTYRQVQIRQAIKAGACIWDAAEIGSRKFGYLAMEEVCRAKGFTTFNCIIQNYPG